MIDDVIWTRLEFGKPFAFDVRAIMRPRNDPFRPKAEFKIVPWQQQSIRKISTCKVVLLTRQLHAALFPFFNKIFITTLDNFDSL